MKKTLKFICCILILVVVFLCGWRVMPRIWPGIKANIIYPIFPQIQPEPAPTPEPYIPHGSVSYGETLDATDSVIYYFYKDYCSYCRELEPLTAGLPTEIILSDGVVSKVKLVCLNKVEEDKHKIIIDYYENHNIPDERQYVPAMVIGDKYYHLKSEIVPGLMDALMSGEGLKRPKEFQ